MAIKQLYRYLFGKVMLPYFAAAGHNMYAKPGYRSIYRKCRSWPPITPKFTMYSSMESCCKQKR